MVDKIDKTTLKILLFIVFLVILYLIVNRKKQIKEGFADLTNEEKIKAYIGGLVKIFKEGKASITQHAVYRRRQGALCLSKGNRAQAKVAALSSLQFNIDELKKKTNFKNFLDYAQSSSATFKAKKNDLINAIVRNLYPGNMETADIHLIRSEDLGDVDSEGWVMSSANSNDGGCRGFAYIKSITYNGETCDNDAKLWEVIEKEATTAAEAAKAEARAEARAVEAEAEALEAAVKTLNNKKKEVIQSYLDLLDDNGIEIVYKQAEEIIDDNDFSNINDSLELDLYKSINDYYSSVISTHKLSTDMNINSCSDVDKKDLSLEDCKEFRRLYVPNKEESSESDFGTYPGISKMTTGTRSRFTEENNFVYDAGTTFGWLSKGCQYRHKGDDNTNNGLYHKENTALKSVSSSDDKAKRQQLTLLCKEKEEEYKPSIIPIADAVTELLNRKKAISIGKQYLNIFKKIIEGYDFGDDENIFVEIKTIITSVDDKLNVKEYDIEKLQYLFDKLKVLSNLITKNNNINLKKFLKSILTLLDTKKPLTDNEINDEINKLQGYVDKHIETEKQKLNSKERITLENSFNLI